MRLSDAEWTVMQVVWQRGHATARDVLDSAGAETGWAYTTVKTVLARLTEKGALSARMDGRTSVYTPQVSQSEARRTAVRSLIEKAFGGAVSPLLQFLDEGSLSDPERARLRDLLDREDAS